MLKILNRVNILLTLIVLCVLLFTEFDLQKWAQIWYVFMTLIYFIREEERI